LDAATARALAEYQASVVFAGESHLVTPHRAAAAIASDGTDPLEAVFQSVYGGTEWYSVKEGTFAGAMKFLRRGPSAVDYNTQPGFRSFNELQTRASIMADTAHGAPRSLQRLCSDAAFLVRSGYAWQPTIQVWSCLMAIATDNNNGVLPADATSARIMDRVQQLSPPMKQAALLSKPEVDAVAAALADLPASAVTTSRPSAIPSLPKLRCAQHGWCRHTTADCHGLKRGPTNAPTDPRPSRRQRKDQGPQQRVVE
jgi:hypothetical protein